MPEAPGIIATYRVGPGSTGNSVTFTLENQWGRAGGDWIVLWIPSYEPTRKAEPAPGIKFRPDQKNIPLPPPGKTTDFTFNFDVDPSVPAGRMDSVYVIMFTGTGRFMRKTLIFRSAPEREGMPTAITIRIPLSVETSIQKYVPESSIPAR